MGDLQSLADDVEFPVECPACGGEIVFTVGELRKAREAQCPKCCERFNLEVDTWDLDRKLADLQRQFDSLGDIDITI